MSEHKPTHQIPESASHATLSSYVGGFILSIALTLTAYIAVAHHSLTRMPLIALVTGLAIVQFVAQAFFFLHLGTETKPRWKLMVFLFMLMVVLILVFGSLWIMTNLNYNMTPAQMNQYMQNQAGL